MSSEKVERAQRLNEHMRLLRERVTETNEAGRLGVLATLAAVPETMLIDWISSKYAVPSLAELDDIESALLVLAQSDTNEDQLALPLGEDR